MADGPSSGAPRKIVVGFDGTDEARDALCFAGRLARLEHDEILVAAAGLFEPQMSTEAEERDSKLSRRALFDKALEELGGRRFEPRIVEGLPVAPGLIALAEEEEADLLVVGTTHRGRIGRVLPGSVGAQLLHGATCPVAIVPRGFRDTQAEVRGTIGVAYDGSHEADLALSEAERLARLLEARMHLITVVPRVDALDLPEGARQAELVASRERWTEALDRGLGRVGAAGAEGELLDGDPGPVLARASAQHDLLVLGSRGRGPLRRTLLGSVSEHVSSNAECPIVVVPRGAEPGPRRD